MKCVRCKDSQNEFYPEAAKPKTQVRLALVTGASGGIGQEIAHLLKSKNIPSILTARNTQGLEQFSKDVMKVNLSVREERKALVEVIRTKTPDLIINNAGFGTYGEAAFLPLEEQLDILRVNGEAVLELTLIAARALIDKGMKGVILNVSSVAGFSPMPLMSVYGATKAFVTNFSQALDMECKPYGVRILVACPGQVATSFASRAAKKEFKEKRWMTMSASKAAKEILWQIEKRKSVHIFDWRYRLISFLTAHLIPEWMIKKTVFKSLKKRL